MRIEKKRRLEEKWGVIRWLTEFLEVGVQEEKCNTKGEGEVEQLEQITTLKIKGKLEGGKENLLEQQRGITSAMGKFRTELWSRDGKNKIN